jgi:hypothetical protein
VTHLSAHSIIWWVTLVALAVIVVMTALQVMRALREVKRIAARVDAYADLPVLKALDKAERDARRLEADLEQVALLVERVKKAVAVIRRGPIPPEITEPIARVRAEIAAFRTFARR